MLLFTEIIIIIIISTTIKEYPMFTLGVSTDSFMNVYQGFDLLVFRLRPNRPVAFKLVGHFRIVSNY